MSRTSRSAGQDDDDGRLLGGEHVVPVPTGGLAGASTTLAALGRFMSFIWSHEDTLPALPKWKARIREPATTCAMLRRAFIQRTRRSPDAQKLLDPLHGIGSSPPSVEARDLIRDALRHAEKVCLARARRMRHGAKILDALIEADRIVPGVSFEFAESVLTHPFDTRLLEPLDLLEIADRSRGERKVRFLLRAGREVAEHLWHPYLRGLWPAAWVLKKGEPRRRPPTKLGALVNQLLEALPVARRNLVTPNVLRLRNACSHTGSTTDPDRMQVRLRDEQDEVVLSYRQVARLVRGLYRMCDRDVREVGRAVGLRVLVRTDWIGLVASSENGGPAAGLDARCWPEQYRRWLAYRSTAGGR